MTNNFAYLPLNVPVVLRAHTGNNIQNGRHALLWWQKNAFCHNKNKESWEQMIILKTEDGKYIIQSRWDDTNLQVHPNGHVQFENKNQLLWEKFDVESDGKRFYFISCHTGKTLQCTAEGYCWCANNNRKKWESFEVVLVDNPSNMLTQQDFLAKVGAIIGFASIPVRN